MTRASSKKGGLWFLSTSATSCFCFVGLFVCVNCLALVIDFPDARGAEPKVAAKAPAGKAKKADEECRLALEANFNAFNLENVDDLMATISKASGTPAEFEEFEREAAELFKTHDIYIRLAHYEGFWLGQDRLLAVVVQHTSSKDPEFSLFRLRSALLPRHEFSQYVQEFLYDKKTRKWLVGAILSKPVPVADPEREAIAPLTDDDRLSLFRQHGNKPTGAQMR
jgi:hypothetical protein